jgi:hypothetical protein
MPELRESQIRAFFWSVHAFRKALKCRLFRVLLLLSLLLSLQDIHATSSVLKASFLRRRADRPV